MQPARLTPNQVVAYNLRRAREKRGWTQSQTAEHLEQFLGVRWSEAVFSAAERSVAGRRIREFDADTIHAFARAFKLPVGYFFLPPGGETVVGLDDVAFEPADAAEEISLASWVSEELSERIDELTRELPNRTRAAIFRGIREHGGLSEDTLIADAVKRIQAEVEILAEIAGEETEQES